MKAILVSMIPVAVVAFGLDHLGMVPLVAWVELAHRVVGS